MNNLAQTPNQNMRIIPLPTNNNSNTMVVTRSYQRPVMPDLSKIPSLNKSRVEKIQPVQQHPTLPPLPPKPVKIKPEVVEVEVLPAEIVQESTGMQIFNNSEFGDVRVVNQEGTIFFAGLDVAKALGYSNTRDAINKHCKGVVKRDGVSQTINQHGTVTEQSVIMSYIPESDLYRLIMRSKLPNAEKFQDWVVEDVLPTIRKHGAYMTEKTIEEALANPDILIQLATTIKVERAQKAALQAHNEAQSAQIALDAPLVEHCKNVLDSDSAITTRIIAKELGMTSNKLNKELYARRVQYKNKSSDTWVLYSEYQNFGYTKIVTALVKTSNGTITTHTTKWTEKGRLFIHEIMGRKPNENTKPTPECDILPDFIKPTPILKLTPEMLAKMCGKN